MKADNVYKKSMYICRKIPRMKAAAASACKKPMLQKYLQSNSSKERWLKSGARIGLQGVPLVKILLLPPQPWPTHHATGYQ